VGTASSMVALAQPASAADMRARPTVANAKQDRKERTRSRRCFILFSRRRGIELHRQARLMIMCQQKASEEKSRNDQVTRTGRQRRGGRIFGRTVHRQGSRA